MATTERAMTIRLPDELHSALEAAAADDDLTMAQVIRRALRQYLAKRGKQ